MEAATQIVSGVTDQQLKDKKILKQLSENIIQYVIEVPVGEDVDVTDSDVMDEDSQATVCDLSLAGEQGREFVELPRAHELLQPLLENGAKITKIRLSTKSFSPKAADVVLQAFKNVRSTLQHIDVSDIIAGRKEEDALLVYEKVCEGICSCYKVKSLNISDNALGEKGVKKFQKAIDQHQSTLENLIVQNVGCSEAACTLLSNIIKSPYELQTFHLYNNMSGGEGAAQISKIVSKSKKLRNFKMASSRVHPDGGQAIAQALEQITSIVHFDLSDNPLTPAPLLTLSRSLTLQSRLTHLNLNDTGLTDTGVTQLCATLAATTPPPPITHLHLQLNEVTVEGVAEGINKLLAVCDTLKVLDLKENELEDEGGVKLGEGLEGSKAQELEFVDVSECQMRLKGAVGVARGCAKCSELKRVEMDGNELGEASVRKVRAIFSKAFPKRSVLGSMDENDGDDDEDEDDNDEDDDDDELVNDDSEVTVEQVTDDIGKVSI